MEMTVVDELLHWRKGYFDLKKLYKEQKAMYLKAVATIHSLGILHELDAMLDDNVKYHKAHNKMMMIFMGFKRIN